MQDKKTRIKVHINRVRGINSMRRGSETSVHRLFNFIFGLNVIIYFPLVWGNVISLKQRKLKLN